MYGEFQFENRRSCPAIVRTDSFESISIMTSTVVRKQQGPTKRVQKNLWLPGMELAQFYSAVYL